MKRWPIAASFVLFLLLCASLAYWAMQLFTPRLRPIAAPPVASETMPPMQAATMLFGVRANDIAVAVASNFQLMGVVVAGNPSESIAILSADGKPARAVRAGAEVLSGVTIKEVQRQYIVLSDSGMDKRVMLMQAGPAGMQLAVSPVSAVAAATPMPTASPGVPTPAPKP
jgi:general secretion pathway protein C